MPVNDDGRRSQVIVRSYCGQAFCTLSLNALLVVAATEVLLSAGKPASASSVGSGIQVSNGNDGNPSSIMHSSCNLDGSGPWWSVDLGGKRASGLHAYLTAGLP